MTLYPVLWPRKSYHTPLGLSYPSVRKIIARFNTYKVVLQVRKKKINSQEANGQMYKQDIGNRENMIKIE